MYMPPRDADFYEVAGVRCPQCGRYLFPTKEPHLYCQTGLGEVAWDAVRRSRYLPEGSTHTRFEWSPNDPVIVEQVAEWESRHDERAARRQADMDRMRAAQVA